MCMQKQMSNKTLKDRTLNHTIHHSQWSRLLKRKYVNIDYPGWTSVKMPIGCNYKGIYYVMLSSLKKGWPD